MVMLGKMRHPFHDFWLRYIMRYIMDMLNPVLYVMARHWPFKRLHNSEQVIGSSLLNQSQ